MIKFLQSIFSITNEQYVITLAVLVQTQVRNMFLSQRNLKSVGIMSN